MFNSDDHTVLMMRRAGKALFMAVVILWSTRSFEGSSNQDKDRNFSLKVPVELVVVPVTVEDNEGKPIAGLQKEDFEILDEGVRQNISYFSADPIPLSVAILIDRSTDNSTQGMIQETMLSLVEVFSTFDEMALFQFEHTTDKIQSFTSNKEDFLKAFKKISLKGASTGFGGGPFSGGQFGGENTLGGIPLETGKGKVPPPKTLNTHIHDAIFAAAQELRLRDQNHRKIMIVISNGQNAQGNRNSYDQTLESLLRTEILVYGIAQGSSLIYRKFNTLSKYTNPTGGDVFYPVKSSGFAETYQKIAQSARNKYVLGFTPQSDVKEVAFRKITVRVKDEKLKVDTVRSRKGYYALPR